MAQRVPFIVAELGHGRRSILCCTCYAAFHEINDDDFPLMVSARRGF